MADRTIPYAAFNFIVELNGGRDANSLIGGFSEVTGLTTEFTMAEYRNGNEKLNRVRKLPGIYKVGDVTLKRGVINSQDYWDWIAQTRAVGHVSKREVVITLRDEAGSPVQKWTLSGVTPMKYTGPQLNSKGGTDVAIEELVLSAEDINFEALA